jgi:glutaredoxin
MRAERDRLADRIAGKAEEIRLWNDALRGSFEIRLLWTEDERIGQFESFCEAFNRYAPKVHFATEKGDDGSYPALLIQESWRYHLIPNGAELEPFMTLISLIQKDDAEIDQALRASLEKVHWPSDIKIYVTTHCPYCKEMVDLIIPFPLINPLLQMTLIDGMLFPELAKADKIHSVPTVICDNRFRWTGQTQPDEIIHVMVHRHPRELGADIFKRMIKEGDAGQLADLMIQAGEIFPAYVDLLAHEKWPMRLGAMVVLEGISEADEGLAREVVKPLWRKMVESDVQVKGDIVYWIGKLGDETWIPRLETLKRETRSEELVEAIDEALENLRV